MKKLLVLCLLCVVGISFAQDAAAPGAVLPGWVISGGVDIAYVKEMGDGSAREGFFQSNNTFLKFAGAFGDGIGSQIKIDLPEQSDGMDSHLASDILVEDLWLEKDNFFNENLRIKAGKMTIPFNQNYTNDVLISDSLSDGYSPNNYGGFYYDGPGSVNFAYGVSGGYDIGGGIGEIIITTFEGEGGTTFTGSNFEDDDSGILESYAIQWNNPKDAFGVAGLGLILGYTRIQKSALEADIIAASVGGSFTVPDPGVTIALEYTSTERWEAFDITGPLTDAAEDHKAALMSLSVDFNNNMFRGIITWEQFKAAGNGETITSISLFGEYVMAANYSLVAELRDIKFKNVDTKNTTLFQGGFRGKF